MIKQTGSVLVAANDFDPGMSSILGIAAESHPSLSNYPSRFSAEGFKVWRALLESPDCQQEYLSLAPAQAWFLIVRRYLKRCEKEGIVAFHHASIQTTNDVVTSFLSHARRQLVKAYRDSMLFDKVSIQKVTRTYKFEKSDFQVCVEATARPGFDPTLKDWLPKLPTPRFVKSGARNGYFHRQLTQHIELYARFEGQRLYVGYNIFCHTVPEINQWKTIPSIKQMTAFAEKTIWLPIVRAHTIPGKGIAKRLF